MPTLAFVSALVALTVTFWMLLTDRLRTDSYEFWPVGVVLIPLWLTVITSAHTADQVLADVRDTRIVPVPTVVRVPVPTPIEACCTCTFVERPGVTYDIAPQRERQ